MFFNIVIGWGLISLIILIHELGHYLFARISKVGVEIFSIGLGYPIIAYTDSKGTKWQLGLIPFGGFILPKDKELQTKQKALLEFGNVDSKNALGLNFKDAGPLKGVFVAIAGPFFNLLTAFVCLVFIANYYVGFPYFSTKIQNVENNSPAFLVGLKTGDIIKKVNETKVQQTFDINLKNTNVIVIDRNGKSIRLELNKKDSKNFGINFVTEYKKVSFFQSVVLACKTIYKMCCSIFNKIFGAILNLNLVGPIGVLKKASEECRDLLSTLLFIIVISVSIGTFNLFPLPILDGGRILMFLISSIIRRPIPNSVENVINYVSIAVIGLIFLATFFLDIKGLIK